MLYDYYCEICNKSHEEFHGMLEKPIIKCNKCNQICFKLIGTGQQIMGLAGGKGLYDFVESNTTGQPLRFHSKRQWQEHLKKHGLNDDVKNSPYTKSELEEKVRQRDNTKIEQRKKIKESVVEVYKEKRNSPEFKQRVKAAIAKDKPNKLSKLIK